MCTGKVVGYGYEANGNRSSLTIGGTNHTTYAYDVADRLTSLTSAADNLRITYSYDKADRLTSRVLPNGITTTYEYDGLSRLTRLKDAAAATTHYNRQYSYNTASRISRITELKQTRNFAYDQIDRLTGMTSPTAGVSGESYAYDAVGNRTSSHKSASYTVGTFNKLTGTANATYSYDANGSMTSKVAGGVTWTYVWDYENRMTSAANGTTTVSYEYDGLGRRTKRTKGTEIIKYTYDGWDVVREDHSVNGITTYQNGLGIDDKLRSKNGSTIRYFITDHLGSTVALADANGAITSSTSYDSFGNAASIHRHHIPLHGTRV